VVLSTTAPELVLLACKLAAQGVPHVAVKENDGDYAGQLTAIGVQPERRSKLRRLFSSLPLLR